MILVTFPILKNEIRIILTKKPILLRRLIMNSNLLNSLSLLPIITSTL